MNDGKSQISLKNFLLEAAKTPSLLILRLKGSSYWSDIAWLASGTALAQLVTGAMLPILSRLFTPTEFAVQALFLQIAGFLAVAVTLRYEYVVQLPESDTDAWRIVQIIGCLAFGLTGLLTPLFWIYRESMSSLAGDKALAPWVVWLPITAAATSMSVALQGYVQRQRKYRQVANAEVTAKVASAITAVAGRVLLPGAGGLVLAGLGGLLAKIAWLTKTNLNRPASPAVTAYGALVRRYSRMSGALVVSHALLSLTAIMPLMFVGHQYGSNTLGQFAMANLIVTLPTALIGGAIGNVYFQRAAGCWTQGKNFLALWKATAHKLWLIGLPAYAVAVVILPLLLPIILGGQWTRASQFCGVLAISSFFSFVTSPMDKACLVVGAWWYVILHHVVRTLTTASVVGIAQAFDWLVDGFLWALVCQMSAIYLLDYWIQWHFSRKMPV